MSELDEIDKKGLHWISRFGWLRSAELGRLLRPCDANSRVRADMLVRRWIARKWVIVRQLPDGAGRAYVLSGTGAARLREAGFSATTGKDWGVYDPLPASAVAAGTAAVKAARRLLKWRAPTHTWKHDLLAAGVLSLLHERGFEFFTEAELKAGTLNQKNRKIPDGLAWRGSTVYWIEVERADKRGKPLNFLATELHLVGSGRGATVQGKKPTEALVAYIENGRNKAGTLMKHRQTVTRAIHRIAKKTTDVTWAACQMKGHGVQSMTLEEERASAEKGDRMLAALERSGWTAEPLKENKWFAVATEATAHIWCDGQDNWAAQVTFDDGSYTSAMGTSTKSEAKAICARLLVTFGTSGPNKPERENSPSAVEPTTATQPVEGGWRWPWRKK